MIMAKAYAIIPAKAGETGKKQENCLPGSEEDVKILENTIRKYYDVISGNT